MNIQRTEAHLCPDYVGAFFIAIILSCAILSVSIGALEHEMV